MQKDNTLGAPTEGLGQTVTFTAEGVGVPQTQAGQRGALRLGITGSQDQFSSRAQLVPEAKPDATFTALAQLGGDMLKPHIEAERQAAYMRGVQQASGQQAITEIVDEQPWYSKLFGSTSLVDGARAYTASTKASAMATSLEAEMPELRKMDGASFAAHTSKLLEANRTGDNATDMMITQQSLSVLPQIMKAQVKANMVYKMEVLRESLGANVDSASEWLKAADNNVRMGDGSRETPDLNETAAVIKAALTKPDSMEQKDFDAVVVDRLIGQVSKGNFALMGYLKDSAYVDSLPANKQAQINEAYKSAQINARKALPLEFLQKEAEWRLLSNNPASKPEDIIALGDELTKEYVKFTGDRAERYFSNAQYVQEFGQLGATQDREAARLAKEAERARGSGGGGGTAVPAAIPWLLQSLIDVTDPKGPKYLRDLQPKQLREFWKEANMRFSPAELGRIRSEQMRAGIYDTELKDKMQIDVNMAVQNNDPAALELAYQQHWLPIVNTSGDMGQDVALAYAGKDVGAILSRYHKVAKGAPADATTISTRYAYSVLPKAEPLVGLENKKSKDAQDLNVLGSGTWDRLWKATTRVIGGDTYPLENSEEVLGWVKGARANHLDDADERVANSIRNTPGLTIVGGYGFVRSTRATNLFDYYPKYRPVVADKNDPADGNINTIFRMQVDSLKDKLKIVGKPQVFQIDDAAGGMPQFAVSGTTADNKPMILNFTFKDAADNYKASKVPAKSTPRQTFGIYR